VWWLDEQRSLLGDHDMSVVSSVSDEVVVLELDRIIFNGTPGRLEPTPECSRLISEVPADALTEPDVETARRVLPICSRHLISPWATTVSRQRTLAPNHGERLMPSIRDCASDSGSAVVMVEQHAHLALAVADRLMVLRHGDVVLRGSAKGGRDDRRLRTASCNGEDPLESNVTESPVAGSSAWLGRTGSASPVMP
jgi:energy-coupling factor transporter ATP-binding protein EcfA2